MSRPVEPGMVSIAGHVEDEAGGPVVGAEVYLLAKGDPMPPVVGPLHRRTDSEGSFSLLREEEITSDLIATCPGFRPTLVEHVGEGSGIRVVMKRGGEIRGEVMDDRENNRSPQPIDASGNDDVYVGRIRQDESIPDNRGINIWVAGDQIRKGAALNAVQIAEKLL